MSNCTKCCTPLVEYPVLSETQFETLTACPNCQSRLITQLALTNRSVAEKCLKTETVPKRYWQAELTDKYKQFDGVEDVLEGNIVNASIIHDAANPSSLKFHSLIRTMMTCPDMEVEDRVINSLNATVSFGALADGAVGFYDAENNLVLVIKK